MVPRHLRRVNVTRLALPSVRMAKESDPSISFLLVSIETRVCSAYHLKLAVEEHAI